MSAIEPIDSKRISPVDRIPPALPRERHDPGPDNPEQEPREEPEAENESPGAGNLVDVRI